MKRLSTYMLVIVLMMTVAAHAQTHFKTLYVFKGNADGIAPTDRLVRDSSGNLFGTTIVGGHSNTDCNISCGTVFELSPTAGGGWKKTTLYRFTGNSDGGAPGGGLLLDATGNLFGTTQNGGLLSCGTPGCGTVFELSPAAGGGWAESTIYSFHGSDGARPFGLVQDASGNLYGVTPEGGSNSGVVYELSPTGGGGWTETVLHTFNGGDGSAPDSTLLLDGNGNLFGTTLEGGTLTGSCKTFGGCGTIFELSPNGGGGWTFSEFALPSTNRGFWPVGSVLEDATGNLFGVASNGGADHAGVAFELSPVSGGGWTESVVHIFDTTRGSSPTGLIEDGNGGFYGSAAGGGNPNCNFGCGVVFHLTPTSQGGWAETVLHNFTGGYDGSTPNRLIRDGSGTLYGTTETGGNAKCFQGGCGTVFEIVAPAPSAK